MKGAGRGFGMACRRVPSDALNVDILCVLEGRANGAGTGEESGVCEEKGRRRLHGRRRRRAGPSLKIPKLSQSPQKLVSQSIDGIK